MDYVTTTGSGAASTTPDAMRVVVAVEVTAPTVAAALAAVAEGARRGGEAARRHTDAARISSRGFRVHPAHDQRGRPTGFSGSHELHLVCDLAVAGDLVTDLGEAVGDALRVHQVQPVVTDTGALLHRARELAFADARAKAQHLAELAGRSLGPALRVREGVRGGGEGWAATPVSARESSVDFEPGSADVTAVVIVRWELTG